MLSALILTEDLDAVGSLSDVFRETGFTVAPVNTLAAAREAMLREPPDVLLMDVECLGPDGAKYLEESRIGDIVDLILITADPRLSSAVRGMQLGAADYLAKPLAADDLRAALMRVAGTVEGRAKGGQGSPKPDASGFGIMHGESPPMRRFFRLLRKVSATGMTVLVTGESGVGKELAARMIHALSDRSEGPLIPVNCGAISAEILESELFGHERGSFTGATKRHSGFFERAHGGTLFLDEITEMSPDLQVTLLRVLETGRLRRVGGEADITTDVRLVVATNRDPAAAVSEGVLREDLYYRLAQFPVRVPALRERGDDVLLLAEAFLAELAQSEGASKTLSDESVDLLRTHTWPGNVRELKNAISRAFVLSGPVILPEDLPSDVAHGIPMDGDWLRIRVGTSLAEVERRAILGTVQALDNDKKAAAEALGISLKTLYKKLKKYRES